MNIALIGNSAKCDRKAFDKMHKALAKKHQVTSTSFEPNKIILRNTVEGQVGIPDVAVVMGGDGTIISAAHYFGPNNQIPIVGINLGKLGYLANFSYDEFYEMALADTWPGLLYSTECPPSERLLLETILPNDNGGCDDVMAVNDFVIDIGKPFRTITVRINVNNIWLADVRGDGVIISSPTGSTAYNLSAGGPILQPEADVISITPKNPHSLSFRPLVVDGSCHVTLRVLEPAGAHLIIDGQMVIPMASLDDDLGDGSRFVEIGKARSKLKLVMPHRTHGEDYWQGVLREKLKWGA